ncbi:hypothetical protein NHN17_25655, partial [Photobacterium sp. ZSDE20]
APLMKELYQYQALMITGIWGETPAYFLCIHYIEKKLLTKEDDFEMNRKVGEKHEKSLSVRC